MRISDKARDLAAAASLSALLFAAAVLLPLAGPPAGFLSAAPLIWVAGRHGRLAGALSGALATLALLFALPPPLTLVYGVEHALPAWYLGWRIRTGRGIAVGSAVAAAVVALLLLGSTKVFLGSGEDPVQQVEAQLRQGFAELQKAGTGGAVVGENLERVLAFVRRVLPAVTLIGLFLEFGVNSLLAARVLALGGATAGLSGLARFRLPEWLVWVVIPALALCWAPQRPVATAALNVLLPLLLAYLLQGLSILLHLAERARLSRFARALLVFSLVFFPWLLFLPLLLGLLDFRFGFRERRPAAPPPT